MLSMQQKIFPDDNITRNIDVKGPLQNISKANIG